MEDVPEAKQAVNNSEKQEPLFSGSIIQTDWGKLVKLPEVSKFRH